ncbi:hypothetical protein [Cryptosporangium sp. NPDC051539]|uniref:hypothetical protein n=1 Tax=Cryptosporangium sp. NPDC051539 TaxID=3363962 RepID=UPI0037A76844
MDETRTRALLAEISADPSPPTEVDLDRVVVLGRRQRRRTGRWVAAAAAVVVLVVAGTTVALLRPDPVRPAPAVTAPAPPPVTAAPTSFDPLRTLIEPGWLPEELKQVTHTVSPTRETYEVWGYTWGDITIDLVVPGTKGPFYGGQTAAPVPAPKVNGVPSTWTAGPKGKSGGGWLTWEWAPGAQAVVRVLGFEDARTVAVRVASSTRAGAGKPVTMPFTVRRPTGLTLVHTSVARVLGSPEAQISFNGDGGAAHAVTVALAPGPPSPPLDVNATLNGVPVRIEETSLEVTIQRQSGPDVYTVTCQVRKGHSVAEVRAECERVGGSLRPVGSLADDSTWTTTPVR